MIPEPAPGLEWVAIDLDGTLAESVWPHPGVGDPIPQGVELARAYKEQGYRIVIHTARHWGDAPRIEEWAKFHGVPFDQVVCGKVLAGLYVDDRAYRVPWGLRVQVVGLTGYARAGKDTVASMMEGFQRLALADALKGIARAIGWDGSKADEDPCPGCGHRRGRPLLQALGTEGVRTFLGEDAWTRALERLMTPGGRYVITDVRFPNEAAWVRSLGGRIWRVSRPGTGGDGHASERGIDEIAPDLEIANDGTIGQLRRRVELISRFASGTESAGDSVAETGDAERSARAIHGGAPNRENGTPNP